jgi:hypothetical protein
MRGIHLAATLLVAATTAAGEDGAAALQGKWQLDKIASAEATPEYAQSTAAQQAEIKQRFAALRDTTFEFTGNELYYGPDGSVPDLSTFRVLGTRNGRIELEITSERYDGQVKVEKATAELFGSDGLRLIGADSTTVLRRAQSSKSR